MTIAVGLLLALLSTVALNWSWFAQHGAARGVPPLTLRHPLRSLRSLFGDRAWLVGFFVGIGGWALYVAALTLAPLSLVQATSAGGIAVLAAFAQRRGDDVRAWHWGAVALAMAGLVLLGVSLAGGAGNASLPGVGGLGAWLALSAVGAAIASTGAALRLAAGAGLGLAAGVLYGAGDVGAKAATFGGAWLWLVPLVLAAHGGAFLALQFGFQRGGALATAGTASLLTNALPILGGIALFHEALPGGVLGTVRVLAFACVVLGAAALSRPESPAASKGCAVMSRQAPTA